MSSENVEIQLKQLSEQFNMALNQYTQTYQTYLNLLNVDLSSNVQKKDMYMSIPNSTFWGTTGLSESKANTENACIHDCINKTGCTGATYNTTNQSCWLRGGEGIITKNGDSSQTAIVQKKIYYANQLKDMNLNLMNLNQQMTTLVQNNWDKVKNKQGMEQIKRQVLKRNEAILQNEKQQIHSLLLETNTLNESMNDSSLLISMEYYRFILFLIITIILAFLFFRILASNPTGNSQLGGGTNMFWKKILKSFKI
jgi:hypothetical protein